MGVYTKCMALPLTFQYQLTTSFNSCESPVMFMNQLICQLESTNNVSSAVKLLTVLHNAIYERDYKKEEL